jgi:hypothetical protein
VSLYDNRLTSLPQFLFEPAFSNTGMIAHVFLSNNLMTGTFPNTYLGLNPGIGYLDISNNFFVGIPQYASFIFPEFPGLFIFRFLVNTNESVPSLSALPGWDPSYNTVNAQRNRFSTATASTAYWSDNATDALFYYSVSPQTYDMCLADTHNCSQICADGWCDSLSF